MAGPARLSSDLDALLRRVARGDRDAFAAVYDLTKARVYGLVVRVLRDSGYSEETTQEVYLEVWRTASEYDSAKGSALAWLLTMAHRRGLAPAGHRPGAQRASRQPPRIALRCGQCRPGYRRGRRLGNCR